MSTGHARWSLGAVVVLLAVGLAGCLTGEDPTSTDTMVTATMVDPWEDGETKRVLWEGTVVAGECHAGATAGALIWDERVMGGCAYIPPDEVERIPVGTGSLLIEADATNAHWTGEYFAFLFTSVRTEDAAGEPSEDAVHTWVFPLEPGDWAGPYKGPSSAWMGFWTEEEIGGDVSLLQGTIDARVIAEKDAAWPPPARQFDADPQPSVPDPSALGPLSTRVAEYDFGWTVIEDHEPEPGPGATPAHPSPVRGVMAYPMEGDGPFPVVVFIHGAHATCDVYGLGSTLRAYAFWAHACPEAPPATEPRRHYQGFDYMLETLASHGYIVLSVDASWVDDRGRLYRSTATPGEQAWDLGARGQLVLATLDEAVTLAEAAREPVGAALVGKLDLERIGLMGYSRGGGGVLAATHQNLERPEAEQHEIRAVFTIVPAHYLGLAAPEDVAYGTLLAYCDASGTGYPRYGTEVFDRSRYDPSERSAPLVQVLAMAANHEGYNAASRGADSGTHLREYCSTHMGAGGGLLPEEDQQAHATVFVNGFMRAFVGEEEALEPLFTGASAVPPSACPARVAPCSELLHVSWHPPTDRLVVVEDVPGERALTSNALGGTVTFDGFESVEVCQAGSCPSGITRGEAHHVFLVWEEPARYELEIPSKHSDVLDHTTFSFRVGVDPTDGRNPGPGESQELRVVIEDATGTSASVTIGDHTSALYHPPGEAEDCWTAFSSDPCWREAQVIAHQARVPLAAFAEQGVDLSRVASVALVFDQTASGAVQVTDLMFW